jgi:hypothetical protein
VAENGLGLVHELCLGAQLEGLAWVTDLLEELNADNVFGIERA